MSFFSHCYRFIFHSKRLFFLLFLYFLCFTKYKKKSFSKNTIFKFFLVYSISGYFEHVHKLKYFYCVNKKNSVPWLLKWVLVVSGSSGCMIWIKLNATKLKFQEQRLNSQITTLVNLYKFSFYFCENIFLILRTM